MTECPRSGMGDCETGTIDEIRENVGFIRIPFAGT